MVVGEIAPIHIEHPAEHGERAPENTGAIVREGGICNCGGAGMNQLEGAPKLRGAAILDDARIGIKGDEVTGKRAAGSVAGAIHGDKVGEDHALEIYHRVVAFRRAILHHGDPEGGVHIAGRENSAALASAGNGCALSADQTVGYGQLR